ncbi:hypothetical protein RHSIM_RhsimUnG0075400 [Rhododendron simsii]|uniref:Uncharacterized protein n=1 Tax=Rhododendron simsii TaxID=118357 RepID=A0A834FW77_RHOSS|nr:hypothetical protein RHSIM_RhsimUnG0075400 [Rhododendron simsii]
MILVIIVPLDSVLLNEDDNHGVSDSNTDLSDGAAASQNRLSSSPYVNILKEGTAQEPVKIFVVLTLLLTILVIDIFRLQLAFKLVINIFRLQLSFKLVVLFGFMFGLIGSMLQRAHLTVAFVSSQAGYILVMLGFYLMMTDYLPESYFFTVMTAVIVPVVAYLSTTGPTSIPVMLGIYAMITMHLPASNFWLACAMTTVIVTTVGYLGYLWALRLWALRLKTV